MPNFFLVGAGPGRRISLSAQIAEGLTGTIHRVAGEPGLMAKLYKDPSVLPEYRTKIEAMLAAPPRLPAVRYQGRSYVQIAWPTGCVFDTNRFRGFVMPEVDLQHSTELENILQKKVRQKKQLPEFYGTRVLLAANLAALIAELHALRHYMIDMKPMNMRFYPQTAYMAILDTDGFSINGKTRLPGRQFSDDYIAPEAKGKHPEALGLEQDLFALAVIIFQLLNNGIHPYQGIDAGNYPSAKQDRIFAGLYAYGLTPRGGVKPSLASIHDYLEDSTRILLDRAFLAGMARPTAATWRDHLNGLIKNNILVKCAAAPGAHAKFSKGCGWCALDRDKTSVRTVGARAFVKSAPQTAHASSAVPGAVGARASVQSAPQIAQASSAVPAAAAGTRPTGSSTPQRIGNIAAVVLAVIAIAALRVALQATSTPRSTAEPQHPVPSITFRMRNNHPNVVALSFYSTSRNRSWPGNGQAYSMTDGNTHDYKLTCDAGETICYGAWLQGSPPNPYWGAGYGGRNRCEKCCSTCDGGETEVIPLDP